MLKNLLSFSLRNRLAAVALFFLVIGGGLYGVRHLTIDAFPDISPNLVQVFAEVDGLAAQEGEALVTRPVEIVMRSLPGVVKVRSLSSFGLITINIFFDENIDIYRARQLVTEKLGPAEAMIPDELVPHGLELGALASGMGKVMGYYLSSRKLDLTELRDLQEWVVKRELQTVPGVAKVISQGGHLRQFQIRLDAEKLAAYNLGFGEVAVAVNRENRNFGAGILDQGAEELIIRGLGRLENLEDLRQLPVAWRNRVPIRLMELGEIETGAAFRRGVALRDGIGEVVSGTVHKSYGANTFKVVKALKARLAELESRLPEDVELRIFYDQGALVTGSIATIRNALFSGLLLVSAVSLIFLRRRRAVLVVVGSLPFACFFSLTLLYLFKIPGDLLSFGGIAIAMGMIVDATIIMVERLQSAGGTGKNQAGRRLRAAAEVAAPIFFAGLIIIIVFIPIFTLGGVEGKMFRPLALTVSLTIAASLGYALMLAPAFCSLLPATGPQNHHRPPAWHRAYQRLLTAALNHRRPVITITLALLVGGTLLLPRLGREFVPTLEEGTIQCLAYMNPEISLSEITRMTSTLVEELKSFPEVEEVVADIGYGEVGPHMHHTNYACLNISLVAKALLPADQAELSSRMAARVKNFPGVSCSFSQPIQHEIDGLIGGSGSTVAVKLFGEDFARLKNKAEAIRKVLAEIDGAADLRVEQVDGQRQLRIILDQSTCARHGLSRAGVLSELADGLAGIEVGRIFRGERTYGINLRLVEKFRHDQRAIGKLLIPTPAGYRVPLRELGRLEVVTDQRQIRHEETRRYITIEGNVRGRDSGGFVEEARHKVAAQVTLAPGQSLVWGGQFELREAANRRLLLVVPLTLLLVVILLYGLFNSGAKVALILINLPPALVGGVISLALFQESLSIPASIGFIALFGIALTDALVLTARLDYLKSKDYDLRERIVAACTSKLRPVLITSLTTAAGLLPLVLAAGTGAEIQRPLAVVVVGGIVTSTLTTLFVLPVIYEIGVSRSSKGSDPFKN